MKSDVDKNFAEQYSSHIKVGDTVELLDLNKATLDEVSDFIVDTTAYGKLVNPEIQHPEFFDEEKRTLTHLEFGGSETRGVMLLKKK